MLGRTHMAYGALGATILVPFLLHDTSAHSMMTSAMQGHFKPVQSLVEGIVAGALGGILPDLDQKDGLMTRQVERIGQVAMLATLVVLLAMLKLWLHPVAIGIALFLFLSFVHHAEWVRRTSLILLMLGAVYFEMDYTNYIEVGTFAAIWFGITAFSKHRTFTHSILGFGVAAFTLIQVGNHFHVMWLAGAAMLGYGLHLLADAIAGGVPMLWPVGKRQGVHLVKTGGTWDHVIGGFGVAVVVAMIAF